MSVVISTLIAFFLVFIAFQQYLLAKEKLKLDLFEKRFAIYKAIQTYLDEIRKSEDASDKLLKDFEDKTHTAKFLFDSDVADFTDKLYSLGLNLNLSNRPNAGLTPGQLAKNEKIKEEAIAEFMRHNKKFYIRFLPYLKFRKWSNGIWIDYTNKLEKDYRGID